MWVRRSDWDRVTDREELVGRLSVGSRFPQYLNGEFLLGGEKRREGIGGAMDRLLDDGNVHGSCGASAIDLCLSHFWFKRF